MEKVEFRVLLKEIERQLNENAEGIQSVINKEMSKGNITNLNNVDKVLEEFKKIYDNEIIPENKSIAVSFFGKPEITMTYILDSIVYNNKITLCITGNNLINEVIINVILESMRNCHIRNQWINYNFNYNEIYLKDNQKYFNKLVFIGDYLEFKRFKDLFKRKKVEYNNYGSIKLFIDQINNRLTFSKINKYCFTNNIALEVYDDIDDFILECKPEDFAILYVSDFNMINKVQKELKAKEVLVNDFPFDEYKFKVNR